MGKIELDHTGAGSGVTLSSDGTDLLLNGTAIGGGGGTALELYAENPSSPTAPSATGANAVAIGSGAVASGENAIAMGLISVSLGIRSLSGIYSYASGTDSFAAAIANNGIYGANGANSVAMGYRAKASFNKSTAVGGERALASGGNSFAAGGEFQTASGAMAVALGGSVNTASGEASYAYGKQSLADKVGKYAYGAQLIATSGVTQAGMMVLIASTTDATPNVLRSNTNAAGTTNQVILPNNSAYFFSGTIIARQDAASGTDMGAWEIKGAIRREGSAATTTLVKSTIDDFNVPAGWAVALTADTTNGGLAITVTGSAATNIRWVATVSTSEVTY